MGEHQGEKQNFVKKENGLTLSNNQELSIHSKCQKRHVRACLMGTNACYNYGDMLCGKVYYNKWKQKQQKQK